MARQTHVYLFGDQTFDFDGGLRRLLHVKDNAVLISFFERVQHAIRIEIGELPFQTKELFPRFFSLIDLLAKHREAGSNPAIEKMLASIYQFACFFDQHAEGSQSYPLPSETYMIGMCTGLLTAAAVSCCQSLSELLPVAVQAVLVAFRTGLHAMEVSTRVEKPVGASKVWSVMIPGRSYGTVSDILSEHRRSKCLPASSQAYISAVALNGLTVSGPPSALEDLVKLEQFAKLGAIKIPVHAPYHASHLYEEADLECILEKTLSEPCASRQVRIPIISSTTGEPTYASTFASLLHAVLREILLEPLRMDRIQEGLASILGTSGTSHCKVTPIATKAGQGLVAALKKAGHAGIKLDDGAKTAEETGPTGRTGQSKIAIIGMSGRFPDAESPEAFWDILYQGLDVHKAAPAFHWDVKTHVDAEGKKKNTSGTPYGCWLKDPGMFDARFFNMSPREAPQVDPAQRLALLTAYEAIEQAGIVPDATPSTQKDRVGVFYGMTSNDWCETNSAQDIDTYFIPGGNRAFTPGRINYFFKFSGPSYSVDTACSSSLAAIHVACNSLWTGDCDTAIAGGTNVLTNPDFTAGLDKGHFLSRTGNCKTFDDGADGYCRGEGVGTVILKRLEDAQADNDPIQGIILGAYTNHSAEADSITRPHVPAQRFVFDKILNGANLDPYSVSYIEMHGTGTQTGDAGEMQSVLETFAPATALQPRTAQEPLYLGSAKSNIGHGESASGVTGLAKLLLMMRKNIIPPHCGIKTKINHKFPTDLKERNVNIALKPTPWTRPESGTRRALLNNFSAAGGNSALLLEDAPTFTVKNQYDPRTSYQVAVSAKTASSLKGNLASMMAFLKNSRDLSLSSLSYTTTARRIHHPHRVIVSGSDIEEIKIRLEAAIARGDGATRPKCAPKIAFAFTGQGSQYPGMGKQLFEGFAHFRSDIKRFDQIGRSQGFPSILPLIQAEGGDISEFEPLVVQLGSACMQMALARLWTSWGLTPIAVIGHSLGEYAALNAAGVLSDSDTIYLTGKRAQMLQERCSRGTHAMLAVKASVARINASSDQRMYEIACINAPEETVLSGTNANIDKVAEDLAAQGIKGTKLKVPFAFHSSQVQPILESFAAAAQGVTFHKPTVPVLCPLLGKVVTEAGTFGPAYLSRHCRETVDVLGALKAAKDAKVLTDNTFVEIGAHPVVSGMIRATLGSTNAFLPSLQRGKDTWKVLSETLASLYASGAEIRWAEYHRDFKASQEVIQLPAYSWDLKNYWMQYVNDWSLRKGDAPEVRITQEAAVIEEPKDLTPNTTCVQRMLEEKMDGAKGLLVFESDILRGDLAPIVMGHTVNGVSLCTPSVYADIALTIGKYLLDRYKPDSKNRTLGVDDMTIEKPLIARSKGPQMLRTSVDVDWTANTVVCKFYSVNEAGQKTIQHAWCNLGFANAAEQLTEYNRNAYLIRHRMVELRKGLETGQCQKFNRSMCYKMVSSLAGYAPEYRGVDEVILDSTTLEASSRVCFQNTKKEGTYYLNPCYIDSLAQTGGFVMNANDGVDLEKECFVNHGWKSFQFFKEIDPQKSYQTYVRMQKSEHGKDEWAGDVMIFDDEDTIMAIVKGIVLQGVPRRLMNYIVSAKDNSQAAAERSTVRPPKTGAPSPMVKAAPAAPKAAAPKTVVAAAPKAPAPAASNNAASKTWTSVLGVISEESGVAVSDLTDDSHFADMGVDSLLALIVASRCREEFSLEVESAIFMEYPTVKALKDWFLGQSGSAPAESVTAVPEPVYSAPEPVYSAPAPVYSAPVPQILVQQAAPSVDSSGAFQTWDSMLAIISEESGVALSDLTDDSHFADMGVDSLLALIVASRCREELEVELESAMFIEFPTVGALKGAFLGAAGEPESNEIDVITGPSSCASSMPGTPYNESYTPYETDVTEPSSDAETEVARPSAKIPPSRSIVLQGLPQTAKKTLFFLPDGCGSASSYQHIPRVDANIAIVGLNCPFMTTPQNMNCTVDDLAWAYIKEIRRRQPSGPYFLGGWSAGGILAYNCAQKLIKQGEEVKNLILIDSPPPFGLDRLPKRFYDYCNRVGLFGDGGKAPPEWLIPHFNASIEVLHEYYATPLPAGIAPRTDMIWACDSVMEGRPDIPRLAPHPDDTEGMKFLLESRTDFSPNGWEKLLGGAKITVEKSKNANHFTMMQAGKAQRLADLINNAMA